MTNAARLSVVGMLAAVFVGCASPGFCDSIVVSSENQKYAIGENLKDDTVIAIGAQETLRIMNSDSGETRVLNGPYTGKISAYAPTCAGVLACETNKKELSIGATRAIGGTNP